MEDPRTNPISLLFNTIVENHIGLIATILVLTICIMWLTEKQVPEMLIKMNLIVISFLFGKKVGNHN